MSSGTIRVPTGEYRFASEYASVERDKKLYIDPSIWCIHGEYKVFDKHIVSTSNVTAHLAQIHPFTLGWLADLHLTSSWTDIAKEQVKRLATCNPTLTVFGGDIISGSGEYLGSNMENTWFEGAWNHTKNRLSNNLWIKGNHDIDPGQYFYYNWFERLWSLKLGNFKFISFDGYSEDSLTPGSCWPGLSLTDIIWLKKRLEDDKLNKIILVHQPLEQWHIYAAWVFKETSGIKAVFCGHSHELASRTDPHKEVCSIPVYINGTCAPEVEVHVATVAIFTKDGVLKTINLNGEIQIKEIGDTIRIDTPETMDWNKQKTKAIIPVRLVKHINGYYLNLIVLCPSEDTTHLQIVNKTNQKIEIESEVKMYILGREIYAKNNLYDSWKCSCGTKWNSYSIEGRVPLELNLGR